MPPARDNTVKHSNIKPFLALKKFKSNEGCAHLTSGL